MSNEREINLARLEHAKNEAMENYFNARPHIERTRDNERLFEAGFTRAIDILINIGDLPTP